MEKGVLLRELAERSGVTEDTVINWELRGVRPNRDNSKKLTEYFDILS